MSRDRTSWAPRQASCSWWSPSPPGPRVSFSPPGPAAGFNRTAAGFDRAAQRPEREGRSDSSGRVLSATTALSGGGLGLRQRGTREGNGGKRRTRPAEALFG
jgi:hypothetical protein